MEQIIDVLKENEWTKTEHYSRREPSKSTETVMCKIANNIIYNNGSLMLLHDMSPAICEIFRIRKSHKSIPFHSCKILVSSLVLLCMDYCNILLVSLPACLINKLESLYRHAVQRTL